MNAFFAGKLHFFFDEVSIIHDIITTPNPFPYRSTAEFMFVGDRNNKTQQIKR